MCRILRLAIVLSIAVISPLCHPTRAYENFSAVYKSYDIPAGPAVETLNEFSAQSELQLLFDYNIVISYMTPHVQGMLTAQKTLEKMLRETNLTYDWINDRTLAVTETSDFCRPELGATAPLPPCRQRKIGTT